MAFTFGFYNALNHDRRYNAIQVSSIFDGIIKDGIFMSIGGHMNVKATGNGFNIVVESGRAWFNHTWSLLDADYPMVVSPSDVLEDRIDVVVLEVNENVDVRLNSIKIIKGEPAAKPAKPALTNNLDVHQYPLAYITVPANSVTLTQSNVENAVGTSATPFVTGILETIDIDDLIAQWKSQWNDWTEEVDLNWNNWFDTVDNAWTTWFTQQQSKWEDILADRTEEWEEIKDTIDSEWASQQGSINSDYTNWKQTALAAYNQWLEQIQGTLDDDAATQLAAEIVELQNRDDVISTYQHVKSGTEHMFIGSGSNGKVKMRADVASGDTVVISSAPKNKVTVQGETSQPGTGDPSPNNIRMIDGVGRFDRMRVFDGSENWGKDGYADVFICYDILSSYLIQSTDASVCNAASNNLAAGSVSDVYYYQKPDYFTVANAVNQVGRLFIATQGRELDAFKEELAAHPLIVWYRSIDFYKSKGPFYYVHEVSDGTTSPYKAIGIELNAPLFDGDSLEIGGLSGCDQMVVLDGSEDEGWDVQSMPSQGSTWHAYRTASTLLANNPIDTSYRDKVGASSYLPKETSVYWGGIRDKRYFLINEAKYHYVGVRYDSLTSLDSFKSYLQQHPLIVFYKSVNYTEEADIPVSLEKRMNWRYVAVGDEDWRLGDVNASNVYVFNAVKENSNSGKDPTDGYFVCSHFNKARTLLSPTSAANHTNVACCAESDFPRITIAHDVLGTTSESSDALARAKSYLSSQYSLGTPIQVVYELASSATYAHPIQPETLPAYYGTEGFVTALAGEPVTGKWLSFTNDGTQLNFKGGGGIGVSKLAATTALPADVVSGKTFYSKDKTLKTGTITDRAALTDAVNVGNDGNYLYARIPQGAYRTNRSTGYPEIRFPNSTAIANIPGGDNGAWNGTYSGSNVTIPQGYHNGNGSVGVAGGNRGNWSGTYSGSDVTIPQGYHAGGGKVGVAGGNRGAWNGTYSGSDVTIPQGYHNGSGSVGVSGGNKGAWGSTINPGGSVTIPQGYHNGQGRVRANSISVNYMAIDSDAYWNDNVQIYESENVSPGTSGQVRYTIQYWSTSEYNVSGYFQICRNGSEIESIRFEKNGGLPTEPSGFFDRTYSEPGTYSLRIRIDYHAGNGTMHIGGVIVGY